MDEIESLKTFFVQFKLPRAKAFIRYKIL